MNNKKSSISSIALQHDVWFNSGIKLFNTVVANPQKISFPVVNLVRIVSVNVYFRIGPEDEESDGAGVSDYQVGYSLLNTNLDRSPIIGATLPIITGAETNPINTSLGLVRNMYINNGNNGMNLERNNFLCRGVSIYLVQANCINIAGFVRIETRIDYQEIDNE